MRIRLDWDVPDWLLHGLRVGLPILMLVGGAGLALAAGLTTFSSGESLSSAKLNANFQALQDEIDTRIAALEAAYVRNQSASPQDGSFNLAGQGVLGGSLIVGAAKADAAPLEVTGKPPVNGVGGLTGAAGTTTVTAAAGTPDLTTQLVVGDGLLVNGTGEQFTVLEVTNGSTLAVTPAIGTAFTGAAFMILKPIARFNKSDGSAAAVLDAGGNLTVLGSFRYGRNGCYTTACNQAPSCDVGYFAVRVAVCNGSSSWDRNLTCCR